MMDSLLSWLKGFLVTASNGWHGWHNGVFQELERRLHLTLDGLQTGRDGVPRYAGAQAWAMLEMHLRSDEDAFLNVLHFMLWRLDPADSLSNQQAATLDRLLLEASSAWKIAMNEGHYGLEKRVDEAVQASVDAARAAPGRAGEALSKAWAAAYSRHPNPSESYTLSIKAVEAAARPIVSPKDSMATIGKMAASLRDAPQKWELILAHNVHNDGIPLVSKMMEQLQAGQHGRHGSNDPSVKHEPDQSEAFAAIHLAALLVQWFSSGVVTSNRNGPGPIR
jgi:hypothetical protein